MHVLRGETETKACSSVYWLVFTFKRIYSYMYPESQSQWTVLLVMRVFQVSIVSLLIAYSHAQLRVCMESKLQIN